jgi:hypothetical protein
MTVKVESPIRPQTQRMPPTVAWLIGLLALLVVGAVQGGIAMISDPLEPLGMPTSFLDRAPIDTYFWPGVFLLATAGASLVTISGLIVGWRWHWAARIETAVRHRWPWLGALVTGTVLLIFEIIELFMVPFHPVMHPLLIAGSIAIIWLTVTPSTRVHLRVHPVRGVADAADDD